MASMTCIALSCLLCAAAILAAARDASRGTRLTLWAAAVALAVFLGWTWGPQ